MSDKQTDRVDWALREAQRMISDYPHSPNARAAAVLADEVQRLREERDEQDARWQEFSRPFDKAEFDAMYERMVAAEAEVRQLREAQSSLLAEKVRLTEGLREAKWLIGAGLPHTMEWHDRADAWYTQARALLAASPPDGGDA